MKLIQLNVWGGRLSRRILSFLETEQPDIVCMQEVFRGGSEIRIPDNQFNILELTASSANLSNSFFAPKYSLDYGGQRVEYGNAMVSKQPFLDKQVHFVKGGYIENIDPTSALTSRDDGSYNVQLARLNIGEQTVTIANHHGFWQPDPMGTKTSVATMQKAVDVLRQVNGPLIFCGDLNVISQSPAMRVFDGFLQDLTAIHDVQTTLGKLHFLDKPVPCDHILTSPEIQVQRFEVADPLVSDHQALILEFSL